MTTMEFEILEDGQIVIKTSEIAEKDHASADEILDLIEQSLGGERKTEKREHPFWRNKNVARGGRIVEA